MVRITDTIARKLARELGVDLRKLPLKWWKYAIKVELEHGTEMIKTNVTNDDLTLTAKIALAHLNEFPDYYQRLKRMEQSADKYWKGKRKPKITLKRKTTQKRGRKSRSIRDEIKEFFRNHPNPSDEEVHDFAEELGINKHRFEEEIYALLTDQL